MPCGRASDQIEIFSIYLPEIPIQYLYIISYSSITWGVLRCLLGFLALWAKNPAGAIMYFLTDDGGDE